MNRKRSLRYLPAAIGVLLSLLIGLLIYLFKDKLDKPVQTRRVVQQIAIVPPPPPPPPPEVKPPEPEIEEEKIEEPKPEPEPEPEAEAPPPGEDLGVDAEGGAGSDGFGLVGKKGGQGLIGGGGAGGNARIWQAQQIQRQITEALQHLLDGEVRRLNWSARVNTWIGADGRVRIEFADVSGDAGAEAALRAAQSRLPELTAPPEMFPKHLQPIRFQLRNPH